MPIKAPFLSFLSILSPIGAGILLYLFFRGIPYLHANALLTKPNKGDIFSFCVYNLPDALWLFAFLQAFKVIWQEQVFTKGLPWVVGCISGALLSEYAQKLHLIPGTFDWLDIIAYALAAAIFIFINKTTFINQNKFSV